jgi:ParB family chromosome partitioning protein
MNATAKRPKGLGRGLDALLGNHIENNATPSSTPLTLDVGRLRAGKYQPRTHMEPEALAELAASIASQGIIQPILVRPIQTSNLQQHYEIIAGERRFRAAQLAGLNEVPVVIREIPDDAALAMALIENIQREDLNPLEEAIGVQRLIAEFQFTHEQAAHAIGRSRSATTNLLRLLQLAPPVQALLMEGKLDMGHARALLPLNTLQQIQLAQNIVAKGLSVRQAETLAARANTDPKASARANTPKSRDIARLEEQLSDRLAAQVAIQPGRGGKGQIVIQYATLDQLQGILDSMQGTDTER